MGQSQSQSCSEPCSLCHLTCHYPSCPATDPTVDAHLNGVPFIPECELFFEGGPDAAELNKMCQKNPGHLNFIPVTELNMEHLPEGYRTDDVMEYIKQLVNETVKITVKYTSLKRPDTYPNSSVPYPYRDIKGNDRSKRCGTGVFSLGPVEKYGQCPCRLCERSDEPKRKYLLGIVSTAAHVIFDDAEAKCSTFELFYDSEDNKDAVICLDGIGLFGDNLYNHKKRRNDDVGENDGQDTFDVGNDVGVVDEKKIKIKRCHQDRMWVLCVTHDLDLLHKMDSIKMQPRRRRALPRKYGVIVSHPHGLSKRISFGYVLHHRYPLSPNQTVDVPYSYEPGVMCRIRRLCHCQKTSSIESSEIAESLKQIQHFLKLDIACELGVEYKIKHRISILPPPNAIFLSESVFQKGCADYWVRFHPGTKFALQDGGVQLNYFTLPDAEFNFFEADFHFYTGLSYATYNIDTCPGSSGAILFFTEIKEFHGQHSGALGNSINRSALDFY